MCPIKESASDSFIAAFHMRIVPSCDPEMMRWPSGENATEKTGDMYIVNGPASVSPVVAFHTQIVPSCELETMRWPSGENATNCVCPVNRPASLSPVLAFH